MFVLIWFFLLENMYFLFVEFRFISLILVFSVNLCLYLVMFWMYFKLWFGNFINCLFLCSFSIVLLFCLGVRLGLLKIVKLYEGVIRMLFWILLKLKFKVCWLYEGVVVWFVFVRMIEIWNWYRFWIYVCCWELFGRIVCRYLIYLLV